MYKGLVRKNNRLKDFNYSNPSDYFVTICVNDLEYWFGKIENEIMFLNQVGSMAEKCWLEIPKHFPNIELDEFIIMPNHIHGIITVLPNKNDCFIVGKADLRSLHDRTKMLLPKIIHCFKSSVTREINKTHNGKYKIWRKSYHDHIIRNEKSLNNIRDYITNNPIMWDLDRNNPKNINNFEYE